MSMYTGLELKSSWIFVSEIIEQSLIAEKQLQKKMYGTFI